jgi:D-alanyl-D-alanine dipeptidase
MHHKIEKILLRPMFFIAFSLLCTTKANAQIAGNNVTNAFGANQIMVVLTNNWDNLQGKMYAFEKVNDKWQLKFSNPVVFGSKGLGIGDGITPFAIDGAPVKKEGDKKSPAGIFSIGTAFGYAEKKDAAWIRNPYVRAFDTLICVDDMHSANYNVLVDKDTAKKDYNSFEYMHRKDDHYKWGLFINHNSGRVTPGDGSCIFMHIWKNDHEGTDGCTAMEEADLLNILHWIDAKERPLLVQFPKEEYDKLRAQYGLPEIN